MCYAAHLYIYVYICVCVCVYVRVFPTIHFLKYNINPIFYVFAITSVCPLYKRIRHLVVYAALYGSGCHLIAVTVMTLCFCLLGYLHGKVYEEPGEMSAASIMCYVASAPVAGYTSGRYYRQVIMT